MCGVAEGGGGVITEETITDGLRKQLDEACARAAAADQAGPEIEHLNHAILDAAHALGRWLVARQERDRRSK